MHRWNEGPKLWFRSERFFRCNGLWYFHTREGLAVGPYESRLLAEIDAGLLVALLKDTPAEQVRAVIRDFILHAGGEFDYVNDPAFTNYLTREGADALAGGSVSAR